MKKKILRFLFSLLLLGILPGCIQQEKTLIPEASVHLELNLTYQDKALKVSQGYKIYTRDNVDQKIEEYGTGFGGVLVYHGINEVGGESYYAFDAACPHCGRRDITLQVDSAHLYAVCPNCGEKYDLLYGIGNPTLGISKVGLKRYNVVQVGSILTIRN